MQTHLADGLCLGVAWLRCNYNAEAPVPVQFTLGHLIAAVAFLLAFSQLTRPIIRFRLRAGAVSPKVVFAMLVTGIAAVFVAAILPFWPAERWPLVGYPIFWEIVGALLLVVGALVLIVEVSVPARFRKGNARRYVEASKAIIGKGGEGIQQLADEIEPSIQAVAVAAASRRVPAWRSSAVVSPSARSAVDLLHLWSDAEFCKALVCSSPGAATKIIEAAQHHHLVDMGGYHLLQQLVHQSLSNADSILYREDDYQGLGHYKSFTLTVFGNFGFVQGRAHPLTAWSSYQQRDVEVWQLEKYCEVVRVAVEGYSKSPGQRHPVVFHAAFDRLAHFASTQLGLLKTVPPDQAWRSDASQKLFTLTRGWKDILKAVNASGLVDVNTMLDEQNYEAFLDGTIYGAIAEGLKEYFEALARIDAPEEIVRLNAIDIWHEVFGVDSSVNKPVQIEIARRLIIHFDAKLAHNFDVNQPFYPALARLLILVHGFRDRARKPATNLGAKFLQRFEALVAGGYAALASLQAKFAQNLLPSNTTYDAQRQVLTFRWKDGATTELKLT